MAPTEISTLSLHDALPIFSMPGELGGANWGGAAADPTTGWVYVRSHDAPTMHILSERARVRIPEGDRKSTRLNSSHQIISYAVFCLKKKKNNDWLELADRS